MFLSAARDLITIFIALELSSIPQYILAGWGKNEKSSEAGLKYLLVGAIASSILLYGMALLYGLTGTTHAPGNWRRHRRRTASTTAPSSSSR